MRYNHLLHRKDRAARRGIAVMFALGILSLVIVAVLIFSRRAVIDRKVAAAYTRYGEAKDMAMSGLGRAILQLQKNAALGTAFYSGKAGDHDFDWLWKLDPAKRYMTAGGDHPVRWQYVYGSDGHIVGRYAYLVIGENRLKLNAILDHRFCLAGSTCTGGDECPRLSRPGNTAAELRFETNTAAGSIANFQGLFNMAEDTSKKFDPDTIQAKTDGKVRQYLSPEELFFLKLVRVQPSTLTHGKAVFLFNSAFNISLSTALDEPDAWFGGDTSVNVDGVKNNDVKDKDEFFQRFPIRLADWDTIAGKTGGGDTAVNFILKDAVHFYKKVGERYNGDPEETNTAGIPWLKNWKETTGNWPDKATKSKQIAANLINYNASADSPVVSNVNPTSWKDSAPNYTGNKRTWYLNECGVFLQFEVKLGTRVDHEYMDGSEKKYWYSFGDGAQKNQITVRIGVWPELINMYGTDVLPGDYSLSGVLNFKFDYNYGMSYTGSGSTFTNKQSGNFKSHSKGQTFGRSPSSTVCKRTDTNDNYYQTYKFVRDTEAERDLAYFRYSQETITVDGSIASNNATPTASELAPYFQVKGVEITGHRLIVTRTPDGGTPENVDYAYLPDITIATQQGINPNTPIGRYIAVDDPRHNLHQADWFVCQAGSAGTLDKVNTGMTNGTRTWVPPTGGSYVNSATGWNKDPESSGAANPANRTVSTAYIRHAPMESLWELGAIHRAAPWQTLNFKRPLVSTDPASDTDAGTDSVRFKANMTEKGGDSYGKGDFRILDQVTMQGGESYTPTAQFGKINLNVPYSKVRTYSFASMFKNLRWYYGTGTASNIYYPNLKADSSMVNLAGSYARDLGDRLGSAPDNVRLFHRSDIYLAPADAPFWTLLEKLPTNGTTAFAGNYTYGRDAVFEQLVGRFIGLTSANSMPDSAIVIVLAQSIQDMGGGVEVYRDWNNNNTFDNDYNLSTGTNAGMTAGLRSGYYFQASNAAGATITDPGFFTTHFPKVKEKIETKFGRYENGADRITGETKLEARLQYDQVQRKWKIVQVRYDNE